MASRNPFRKMAPSASSSDDRHGDRMVQPRGNERVLDDVRGRVGGRQRDRDDEAGGREPEQAQDDGLALPPREQVLEHRDAALAVRAHLGDAVVHRQRAEQRDQHEDERRDRRERAGREKGDAGLIAERREVVDAGQAHHLPPGGRVRGAAREARPAARSLRTATVQTAVHEARGRNGHVRIVTAAGRAPLC